MRFRLISFVIILSLALIFVGFNLNNRCTLSFVVYTVKDIPVFYPILIAFTVGMLSSFPFVMTKRKEKQPSKGKRGSKQERGEQAEELHPVEGSKEA